jgi:hypothetical protein
MTIWTNILAPIIQIIVAVAVGYWQIRVARQIANPATKEPTEIKTRKKISLKKYFINEPFWFSIGYILASILNGLNVQKVVNSTEPLTRSAVFYICFYTLASAYWGYFGIQWIKLYIEHFQKQKDT